jgi:ribosomal protein S12 methylthiotransferase
MNLHLVSLGCAKNLVDSETMLGRLSNAGWTITSAPAEAQIILVNTCCFIEPATEESIDTILELARFKSEGACECLVVCGCLPQRYGKDLRKALPEVDLFVGTGAFDKIETILTEFKKPAQCIFPAPDSTALDFENQPRIPTTLPMAYLKIAEGCSRHCTYCIIPKLRGRHRSRPMNAIVKEAETLIKSGALELNLVAQDTTAYGADFKPPTDLARLLEKLSDLSDSIWVRFLYGHPEAFDDDLIRTVSQIPNVCTYFDVPIQHADDDILKRMGRGYGRGDLYRLFDRIRELSPNASIRSSVIVGFPGETEQDVDRLLSFIERIRFDHLGVFVYSDAQDLASHKLAGHVHGKVSRQRRDLIMERQAGISLANNRKYVGQTLKVLVEHQGEDGRFVGRSQFLAPEVDGTIIFNGKSLAKTILGHFTSVRILESGVYDLFGEAS